MTEPKRHRWADVLITIAEGREVQFYYGSVEGWRTPNSDDINPLNHPEYAWRVKPQKLKRWVNVYRVDNSVVMWETREEADKAGAGDCRRIACIEIEFEEGEGL